jgi:lipoprotein-anchoring transpeptidase ErfK/SrfK
MGALIAQIWLRHNVSQSPIILSGGSVLRPNPLATATLHALKATATATLTATPTPGAQERAAMHIPMLQDAWDRRDWKAADDYLNKIATLDHRYPGLSRARCDTYLHWAEDLERQCQIEQAYERYQQASVNCPDRELVLREQSQAQRYLAGKWYYDRSQWSQAAAVLHTVYATDPSFASTCPEASRHQEDAQGTQSTDTRSLLYASYLQASQALLERGSIKDARTAASAALELIPDGQEAGELLDEINSRPVPTPASPTDDTDAAGRRIEVSISKQRMYVWQGDTLLYDWVCSTGGPGTGTATGRYRIQSKIPEAWASQWSLRMPYWLGIYYVGTIENGIHALPIRSNGTTLWAGYLGTPVSYGCIILSTENSRTLYHWADIGTPVWIHW